VKTRNRVLILLSLCALMVAGCGGGGSNAIIGGSVALLSVTVSPNSPATAAVNTTVTITTTVTQNGASVPNGTIVQFAIKSGTGGTLSAASAPTSNGVASVTLTSATDTAAYVVMATVGGVSTDSATITFTDPNKPGSIALSASPTTGVFAGLTPVTLTATVSPAAQGGTIPNGTPVTFTILTGSGTLTGGVQAAIVNTTNGVASVTLNGSAVGSVIVNAITGTAPEATARVDFAQPTQANVTVALTGSLSTTPRLNGSFQRIGATTAKIGYSSNKGLGLPVSAATGIGLTAAIFGANTVSNPTNTSAAWISTILPDVTPTVGTLPGNFQILMFPIAAGNFPTAQDFFVDPTSTVLDDQNNSLDGIINLTINVTYL